MTGAKTGGNTSQVVVIGASSGGINALVRIFGGLEVGFQLPVLVVLHQHPHSGNDSMAQAFFKESSVPVKEIDDKEEIMPGTIYLAPPNYHVLVEDDRTLSLSIDEKVNWSRPSIDVLFESAAEVFGKGVIGVILTGASQDGAAGLRKIKEAGGLVLIQDPEEAEAEIMPRAAMAACRPDRVLQLDEIVGILNSYGNSP